MKNKLAMLIIGGSFLTNTPPTSAQTSNTNTDSLPLNKTVKYQISLEYDRSLGERALLPPGLKEKMRLTDEQRMELKLIEDDFGTTSQEYQTANQPRIDAATEAIRMAREAKSTDRIQAARHQLHQTWAGLQKYRADSIRQVKLILTPEQLLVLEDPANQWHENHRSESNDPSAQQPN